MFVRPSLRLDNVLSSTAGLSLVLALFCCPALAEETQDSQASDRLGNPYIPELKIGFLLHDVGRSFEDSNTLSINLELIWSDLEYWSFDSKFVEVLLNPVPMIGGTINTAGGVNTLYAGIAWPWEYDIGIVVTNSFGVSLNDGRAERDTFACPPTVQCPLSGNRDYVPVDEPVLGSNVLFRYGLDIGYQIDETHTISAYFSHISNAGLAEENNGINFVGIRYGVDLGYLFN